MKARRGSLFHFFFWPPLFMSTFLSFFALFFTSLVVLLYPVLVWFFLRGLQLERIIAGSPDQLVGTGAPHV